MTVSSSLDWLTRGTSDLFPHQPDSQEPRENLTQLLQTTDRPLRIKLGIDPTGSDIHLGHSIPFRKLRAFQDAGHVAVVIIGDFTARIGDPTGKSEVRKQLTIEEVRANAENYLAQLRPILDFNTPNRLEIRYNSEWLGKLDLSQILELLSTMTVGQMLAKEGFSERYDRENPIFLHEFLYPLMQGYDSVAVEADVELGGTDQKFNIAVGRDLQKYFGKKPQFGLLLPILIGTDGSQKMSKSLNNYVGLRESALSMYSKLEKTPDALLKDYYELRCYGEQSARGTKTTGDRGSCPVSRRRGGIKSTKNGAGDSSTGKYSSCCFCTRIFPSSGHFSPEIILSSLGHWLM